MNATSSHYTPMAHHIAALKRASWVASENTHSALGARVSKRADVALVEREIDWFAAQWRERPTSEIFIQLRRLRNTLAAIRGAPMRRNSWTAPRHWTTGDARTLLRMHAQGATDAEIAGTLRRHPHVIGRRRRMLALAPNKAVGTA